MKLPSIIPSFIVATLIAIALGAVGCKRGADTPASAQPAPPTTRLKLLFWGSPVDNPAMSIFQEACDSYAAAHPDVELQVDFYTVEQYKSKLPVVVAANRPPDVFMTWSGAFLETYVQAHKVAPLDRYLDASPEWRNSFQPNAFDLLTYSDQVYAIPNTRAFATLYYNKAIFERLGLQPFTNQAELLAGIRVLREHGVTPFAFGNREPWVGGMLAGQLIERSGGSTILTDIRHGERQWTDPAIVRAGEFLQLLVQQQAFPESPNTVGYQESLDMFHRGDAAMLYMGSWFIQTLVDRPDIPTGAYGVMPFPLLDDGAGSADAWMGQTDMNLAISESCTDKDAAFDLIRWIISRSNQDRLVAEAGQLPAMRIDIAPDRVRPELATLLDLQRDMATTYIFPDIGLSGRDGKNFNDSISRIIAGDDVQTTLRQLDSGIAAD